ncbi:MAG: hypothetical protein HW390_480 [Candidatus Brocadiaceae bacterium]|nr:hypothetical protein [Candidatus Brocadiaceae bacterium]
MGFPYFVLDYKQSFTSVTFFLSNQTTIWGYEVGANDRSPLLWYNYNGCAALLLFLYQLDLKILLYFVFFQFYLLS